MKFIEDKLEELDAYFAPKKESEKWLINYYVKKYTQDIANKKKKIEKTKKKIVFIDMNLNKLSDMLFNQKNWSIFLNSITDRAAVQDVDIQYIANKYVDNNGSFGHVLEVGIGCQGEYKNIVKFMNELEQNVLVTDIYNTKMHMDENSSKIIADADGIWCNTQYCI